MDEGSQQSVREGLSDVQLATQEQVSQLSRLIMS
jgi:hypothetical protein